MQPLAGNWTSTYGESVAARRPFFVSDACEGRPPLGPCRLHATPCEMVVMTWLCIEVGVADHGLLALQVFILKGITRDGIQRLLRYTDWQGDSKQRGQALYMRLGLQLDSKEFDLFSKGIHSLTAGIPALVVPAVYSSVTHRPQGGWGKLTENEMAAMLSPKVDWLTPWEAVVATSPQKVFSYLLPLLMLEICYRILRCFW